MAEMELEILFKPFPVIRVSDQRRADVASIGESVSAQRNIDPNSAGSLQRGPENLFVKSAEGFLGLQDLGRCWRTINVDFDTFAAPPCDLCKEQLNSFSGNGIAPENRQI